MSDASRWEEVPVPDDDSFDTATFESGVEKRVSVILLLDTSQSMGLPGVPKPHPIDDVNSELRKWQLELRSDRRLRHRAEIATISFGDGGVMTHKGADGKIFSPAALYEAPTLAADGVTPMLDAIERAINLAQTRKGELNTLGILHFRTLLFLITDGAPTNREGYVLPDGDSDAIASELRELEAQKKLAIFTVGVRGANDKVLRKLSPEGFWNLGSGSFSEFLRLVSASAGSVDPLAYAREQIALMMSKGK